MTDQEYIDYISSEPTEVEQGNGYKYIKKSVLKRELLILYKGNTKFEIIDKHLSQNGIYGTGLFHYMHPVSGLWMFESGMAAIPFQGGMKLDYPLLKTQIFKNAVKEIGVRFGLTLNLDVEDSEPKDELPTIQQSKSRLKPDSKIMAKFLKAVEDKDEAAIIMLSNVYEIKVGDA